MQRTMKNKIIGAAFATLALTATASFVHAQTYPSKPIRVVIGFPPGGPSDILTRLIGTKLSQEVHQPVIFDNRPGAGGNIAGEIVAKAPPDGYTLLMGNNGVLATNHALYKHMSFNPETAFTPVILLAEQPNILVVHPSLPVHTVKQLIALAKSHPGQLNYASTGYGTAAHLAAALFDAMTGIKMVHVPYKGAAPALTAMIQGQCQVMFATALSVSPYIKQGRLRALAVTTSKGSKEDPKLPTVAEAGVPGFAAYTWHGWVAPAGTPQPIIEKLNAEVNKVLKMPDVRQRIESLGGEVQGGTPQHFAAFIKSEIPKWARMVKLSGAHVD